MCNDDFHEELLKTLRESGPDEVVVANEDAGGVCTASGFAGGAIEALREARKEDLVVLDEAGEHVRTLRPSGEPDRMWMPLGDGCPTCGHTDEDLDGLVDDTATAIDVFTDALRHSEGNRRHYATLTFAPEHVEAILGGEKTVTLRLPDAYDQAVVHAAERGAEVLFTTPDDRAFARAEIRAMWAATARQVAGSKLAGYPTEVSSPDDVLRVLERHYGDELADAGPTEAVDVLHFDVVESYREVSE